ncbi:MAG: bifunctional riboflavin kinase/FMN adenylyltransferase [Phycisphaerales bacterium]|nr:bifunctional riboflavin kinase/FMN adenylyltransferase [Phycisphaerales bacterium]
MSRARTILARGTFDGVHLGHRAIVAEACRLADRAGEREGARPRVVTLAFDPHPAAVLRPAAEPARLTTFDRRSELLRAAGADAVVRLEPTPDLLGLSPERFVDRLAAEHAPLAIVEGPDFRFGKGRAGDVAALRRLGRERSEAEQFAVRVVEPVETVLGDHSIVTASSTLARWLLERGRVADVARVLGEPYRIEGMVVRGDRRGRTLGYPTANLAPESTLPADGVYAGLARASLAQGPSHPRAGEDRSFVAAISVGTKPQFSPGQTARTIEAFLLDVERSPGSDVIPGLPEYGWRLSLDMIGYVRDQARFESVDALLRQMGRDCERVREICSMRDALPEPRLAGAPSLAWRSSATPAAPTIATPTSPEAAPAR